MKWFSGCSYSIVTPHWLLEHLRYSHSRTGVPWLMHDKRMKTKWLETVFLTKTNFVMLPQQERLWVGESARYCSPQSWGHWGLVCLQVSHCPNHHYQLFSPKLNEACTEPPTIWINQPYNIVLPTPLPNRRLIPKGRRKKSQIDRSSKFWW